MTQHLLRGKQAEQQALCFLKRHGLTFIAQNYACPYGEIDLIMNDHNVLAFIEVRYRANAYYGSAIESINPNKQARIQRTAQYFLLAFARNYQYHDARFDVIGINSHHKIDWIKNAFEVQ